MSRATQVLLNQAKEMNAMPFQLNAAAILLAANGLPAALRYLDGCRTRFDTAKQVRAFLIGHGWNAEARTVKVKRSERGWIVRLPPPDGVDIEYKVGVPDVANPVMTRSVGDANRYAEKFAALQQILAGTNAEVWP